MSTEKITEFLLVLVFALAIGAAAILTVLYLEGVNRGLAILGTMVVAVAAWQYLRRRFGRA